MDRDGIPAGTPAGGVVGTFTVSDGRLATGIILGPRSGVADADRAESGVTPELERAEGSIEEAVAALTLAVVPGGTTA